MQNGILYDDSTIQSLTESGSVRHALQSLLIAWDLLSLEEHAATLRCRLYVGIQLHMHLCCARPADQRSL